MPSFFRRLFGFSFRTERLIMNIIGLINSTFEWSPLKWTNELEQIQNISLTYGTLILGTIGEDTIKTVLSWIVITRIVIAHVYTFTYLTNMYPILTWSRPNLLLPWLILSFFKNVVLEVIVLAVCLLYWYDKRFSLAIFLEFVLVKVVPLIVATYNWYSTSCLFLELRHAAKITKLKRNLRSETNFLTGRLFTKIADSRYRSRSLITLLSYESYETVDTQDTISRIIDDPDLTPVQKTMKILGITQQDVIEARIRRRERAVHRRLTEIDDELVGTERSIPRKFFVLDDEYEEQVRSFLERKDELAIEHSTMIEQVSLPSEDTKEEAEFQFSERTEPKLFEEADASKEQGKEIVSTRRRTNETHRNGQCASNLEFAGCSTNGRDCTTFHGKRSIENNCNCPKEARSLFNCDCSIDEKLFEEMKEHCCLPANGIANGIANEIANEVVKENVPNSSTPKGNSDTATAKTDSKSDRRSCTYDQNFLNEQTNGAVSPIEQDLPRNDEKILEGTKGKPCSRRLIAKEKLKEEVEQVTNKMENLEITDREMLGKVEVNPCSEKLETREENGSESKSVDDDSRAKTLIVDEDLKRRVLLVTNKIDSILRNFKYDSSSRRSMTEEQRAENRIEQNHGLPIVGVHKLSKILEDTIRKPVPLMTNVRMPATIDSEQGTSPTRKGRRYESDRVEGNRLTANLPEYSFGDGSIQKFFEDSMKVFDGCYEQDFNSNSELQCIYRQLEKNKWNPFVGRSNLETRLKRDDEIARSTVEASRNVSSPSANDRENRKETERSKIAAASLSKSIYHRENLISRKSRVNEQFLGELSRREPASKISTKSCYVQTDLAARPPSFDKPFERVVADTKNRKKTSLKRKRLQDQVSVSAIRDHRDDKAETRYFPNCHQAEKRNKQRYEPKKAAESPDSDRSVCECKMQQLEAKCSPSSESSSLSSNKKDDRRRGKLDSFGTVTLSRVTRDSESKEGVAHRKKPPICPKKAKPKIPPLSRITPIVKKLEESKRSNANGQNAREMRALKAYNEVTLLRDKEHFDAKRKVLSSGTTAVELLPEQSKHRTRSRKSNSGKKICQDSKSIIGDDEYVNKENLSSVEQATASTSNDDKSVSEFLAGSNENYGCSNLTKVNRVTDKIFDRLFSVRKQSREKSRLASDADIGKQFSEYGSNLKQMLDEQIVSASSSKRLEGTQTGRELERTPAKEDIRDRSNEGDRNVEKQQDRSLLMIKASVNRDVASTWSCNGIDQTDETLGGYPNTEVPRFTEDTKKCEDREEISSGTRGNENEADFERDSGNVETFGDENDEGSGGNGSSRNIVDVSYLVHGVVLSNANADTSKQPRLRDIVDDATSRLLHNAFSYRSMDSIFDFAEESLVANDLANNSHSNALDDDFVCRSSNDAVDVFTDEIPVVSRALDNLEHSVPTVVRESCQLSEREESCVREMFEAEHLTGEMVRRVGLDEFRFDDVLSSIGQLLRTLNVDSFALGNVDELDFRILRDFSRQDDAGEVARSIVAENDAREEEDDEERSEDRMLRFVEDENLFTNIKFPVVINWSDSLAVSNEALLERSNSMLVRQIEPTEQVRSMSFGRLNEEKKMEEGGKLEGENAKNILDKLESSSELERSELVGSCESICSGQVLTDTYRITKYFESDEITSASRSEETVGKVEFRFVEETERNVESKRVEGITEETARIDESEETGENTRSIEHEVGKRETIEAERVAELNERVSWGSIVLIVLMVWWLYIRHFWQTIISSSRSSSSLKPFEIHAVPAPTSSLLERIADDQKEESNGNLFAESANFEATEMSPDIIETADHCSEEIEKKVEEAMLFLGKHLSENVRIPSFSYSDQEKTSERIGSKAGNEETSDLRAAEQEIRTFRFEEADDDSGSANSFFEHDEQTTLFVDGLRAEATIDEDVLAKKIERIEEEHVPSDNGDDPRKEEDAEDRRFSKDETIGRGKLEEAEDSTEEKKDRLSGKIVESKLQNIDSFDSTYSEISDTSKRTVSGFDESSMEEFHTAFNEDN